MNTLLSSLEQRVSQLQEETSADVSEKVKKLQNIIAERDHNANKVSDFISSGESLFPDTATAGREIIRKDLNDIKER